ncbi:MAG: sulfite exporter TauE/SafE family protein [Thiohalocapsa sp.]
MEPSALAAFAAVGAIAGLLAGLLGIGGGAVIVPALLILLPAFGAGGPWTPHQAVATSLATIVAAGSASTLSHHRRGAVRWWLVARLAPSLVLGAGVGALLASWLPALWLQRLFAAFLLASGTRMLLAARTPPADAPLPRSLALVGTGGGIGAVSALLGIGGGILMVPYLARHGVALRHAVATSSACGVPLALIGSLGFVVSGWGREGLAAQSLGFVLWPAALAIAGAAVPMATLGARLVHRLPTLTLKRVFAVLLLAVGVRLLLT